MPEILQETRFSLRTLRKAPATALLAVLALGLGIASAVTVFAVVQAVLLRPLELGQPERLVEVVALRRGAEGQELPLTPPDLGDLRVRARSFEALGGYVWNGLSYAPGGTRPRDLTAIFLAPELFATLGVAPLHGRAFALDETFEDRVVILSHAFWRDELGADPAIVGRSLQLSDEPWTVVGVMPPSFRFPVEGPAFWAPFQPDPQATRDQSYLGVVGRLAPGATLETAQREIDGLASALAQEFPATNAERGFRLTAFQDTVVGAASGRLWLLLAAVGLLLLIACSNVAQLVLARGLERRHELATRAALGASRGDLLRGALVEPTLLAAAGGALGLLVALWATELLATLPERVLPRAEGIRLDGSVIAFAFAAVLLAGPLFGLLPALSLLRAQSTGGLGGGRRGSALLLRSARLRQGLTVAQIGLSFSLLVGAGLLVRSLLAVTQVAPGFEPRGALALQLFVYGGKYDDPAARLQFLDQAFNELRNLPGVTAVGATDNLPLSPVQGAQTPFEIEGRSTDAPAPMAFRRLITPGLLDALERPLVAGRDVSPSDRRGEVEVALLNRSAARRFFGEASPLGARLRLPGQERWATVVGVVEDIRQFGLEKDGGAEVLFPMAQMPTGTFSIVVRSAAPEVESLLPLAQERIWKVDPLQPIFRSASLNQMLGATLEQRRFLTHGLNVFAGLALLLAAVGLYGVISYAVARERKPIAVRVALGARPAEIQRRVLGASARLTLWGVGLGLAGSLLASQWVRSQLFGVQALDPLTLVLAAVALFAVTLLASAGPAMRAARVAPIEVLRED